MIQLSISCFLVKFVYQKIQKIYTVSFRYKGTYCSQEVAIKVLKPEQLNMDMLKEFSQEVFIMRCVSHMFMVILE